MGFPPLWRPCSPPSLSSTPEYLWATPEASRPLLLPRTPKVLPACFPCPAPSLTFCDGLTPWQSHAPDSLATSEGNYQCRPPSARASPCSSPAPVFYVPLSIVVCIFLFHSAPLRSTPPPPSLIPPIPPCSCRSTPCSRCRSPPSLSPLRGALPRHRHYLPEPGVASSPVLCMPDPLLSSSSWLSSSFPLCLDSRPPCSVTVPSSFYGASPPFFRQDLAAARPSLRAPSTILNRCYRL